MTKRLTTRKQENNYLLIYLLDLICTMDMETCGTERGWSNDRILQVMFKVFMFVSNIFIVIIIGCFSSNSFRSTLC